jgi:hypothetical protein
MLGDDRTFASVESWSATSCVRYEVIVARGRALPLPDCGTPVDATTRTGFEVSVRSVARREV